MSFKNHLDSSTAFFWKEGRGGRSFFQKTVHSRTHTHTHSPTHTLTHPHTHTHARARAHTRTHAHRRGIQLADKLLLLHVDSVAANGIEEKNALDKVTEALCIFEDCVRSTGSRAITTTGVCVERLMLGGELPVDLNSISTAGISNTGISDTGCRGVEVGEGGVWKWIDENVESNHVLLHVSKSPGNEALVVAGGRAQTVAEEDTKGGGGTRRGSGEGRWKGGGFFCANNMHTRMLSSTREDRIVLRAETPPRTSAANPRPHNVSRAADQNMRKEAVEPPEMEEGGDGREGLQRTREQHKINARGVHHDSMAVNSGNDEGSADEVYMLRCEQQETHTGKARFELRRQPKSLAASRENCISEQEPGISAKEPCISAKELQQEQEQNALASYIRFAATVHGKEAQPTAVDDKNITQKMQFRHQQKGSNREIGKGPNNAFANGPLRNEGVRLQQRHASATHTSTTIQNLGVGMLARAESVHYHPDSSDNAHDFTSDNAHDSTFRIEQSVEACARTSGARPLGESVIAGIKHPSLPYQSLSTPPLPIQSNVDAPQNNLMDDGVDGILAGVETGDNRHQRGGRELFVHYNNGVPVRWFVLGMRLLKGED